MACPTRGRPRAFDRVVYRIEPGPSPVLHTYALGPDGYLPGKTLQGADPIKVDAPFPVLMAPAEWLAAGS